MNTRTVRITAKIQIRFTLLDMSFGYQHFHTSSCQKSKQTSRNAQGEHMQSLAVAVYNASNVTTKYDLSSADSRRYPS